MIAFPQYTKAVAVVASNATDFVGQGRGQGGGEILCDAIYVGTGGVVPVVFQDGTVVNFTCAAGQILPVKARRVNATNLTAAGLVALYAI